MNDDVFFDEVWSREAQFSLRGHSMITIAVLFSAGLYLQAKSYLNLVKDYDIAKYKAAEIVTQLAFYCG